MRWHIARIVHDLQSEAADFPVIGSLPECSGRRPEGTSFGRYVNPME